MRNCDKCLANAYLCVEMAITVDFYAPCERLMPWVKYYWILRADGGIDVPSWPVGCPMLIFHREEPLYIPETGTWQPRVAVSGQVNFPSRLQSGGRVEMLVAVLTPWALGSFSRVPGSEFYNREVGMCELSDRSLSELSRQVSESSVDDCTLVGIVEQWLLQRFLVKKSLNAVRVRAALQYLESDSRGSVAGMAGVACLGRKQFERVFRDTVGMNPKEYSRIFRFQRAMWYLQQGNTDYQEIVYAGGYADQSHFIREFREFSGMTPAVMASSGIACSELFRHPV